MGLTIDEMQLAMSPVIVMRCAPNRSTTRPAGTPINAATIGPDDMTRPTRAASSASVPER